MPLEVRITKPNQNTTLKLFEGESVTISYKNKLGEDVPAFSVVGKPTGGDIIGDICIHLPCFQIGSTRLFQKAKVELSDKVVDIQVV